MRAAGRRADGGGCPELSGDEMAEIDSLGGGRRGGPEPDPATLEAFGRRYQGPEAWPAGGPDAAAVSAGSISASNSAGSASARQPGAEVGRRATGRPPRDPVQAVRPAAAGGRMAAIASAGAGVVPAAGHARRPQRHILNMANYFGGTGARVVVWCMNRCRGRHGLAERGRPGGTRSAGRGGARP